MGERVVLALVTLLVASATLACERDGVHVVHEVPVYDVAEMEIIIDTEGGAIGVGSAMDVAQDGSIWIADRINHWILSVHPHDGALARWGGPGAGPGEFDRPEGVAVSDTEVVVLDFRNQRLQTFGRDGEYRRSSQLPMQPSLPVSVNSRGDVLFGTGGQEGSLIGLLSSSGETIRLMGEAKAPRPKAIDAASIDDQVRRREIPVEFRNHVLPVLGEDAAIWVVIQAEGTVERYGSDGQVVWSTTLPESDVTSAHETFFRRWEAEGLRGFPVPWTVAAGASAGNRLFLLLQTEERGRSVILQLNGDTGSHEARITLPVRAPAGPIAIDSDGRWLYILTQEASLSRAAIPQVGT
jgi:hypothetical protein